jgi:uncharacterized cupredoxin-like copper-binding protein
MEVRAVTLPSTWPNDGVRSVKKVRPRTFGAAQLAARKQSSRRGSTPHRVGLKVVKQSDVNLAAILAAIVAAAIYGGVHGVGPRPKGHTHTAFAAGEPGDPKKSARVVEITMREGDGKMNFVPAAIEVTKSEQITFVLKNEGELEHQFILDSFERNAKHKVEMEKNPEMEHDSPNAKRISTKKSAKVHWRFTKAGTFEFACLHPGHYDAGMRGVVLVTDRPGIAERYPASPSESN